MTKDGALLELLATHFSVLVYLDSRKLGVIVPRKLRQPVLILKIGLNLPTPIRDLVVEDHGWSATLLLGTELFRVYIPWKAVFGIFGDTGIGKDWPKDIPSDAPPGHLPQRAADVPRGIQLPVPMPPLPKGHPPVAPRLSFDPPPSRSEKRRTLPPWMRIIEGGKSNKSKVTEIGPNPPTKAS